MEISSILSNSSINNYRINLENTISSLNLDCTGEQKINLENVNANLINYLNKEYVELGFESMHSNNNDKVNYDILFNNSIELVKRFTQQQATIDRVQEQCFKLDRENELFLRRQQALKDSNEASNREKADIEEKLRQSIAKNNTLSKTIKEQTEENRKLQSTIETRDKQFKHERKKLEKEIEKLKERVQLLSTGKAKELPQIEMSESIHRRTSGSRATWNTDSNVSKKQIDLYSELIKDYDTKNKDLMTEIVDLKNFISHIYASVPVISNITNNQRPTKSFEDDLEKSNLSNEDRANESIDQILQLPFDNIHSRLDIKFQSKFKQLNELIENKSTTKSTIQNDVNNMTSISTIISASDDYDEDQAKIMEIINTQQSHSKSHNNNKSELNSTFTIDSSSDEDSNKMNNSSKLMRKINSLKAEMGQYKKIIETQSKFIESFTNLKNMPGSINLEKLCSSSSASLSSSASTSCSENESNNNNLNNKNQIQITARKKENSESNNILSCIDKKSNNMLLDQEKRSIYEQKMKLEQETVRMRKTWDQINKKQKELKEEQESFYQSQVYASFFDNSNQTIKSSQSTQKQNHN